MNAVNAVQLFILVWTFTAVCQADDHISVSCEDVTGAVGEEVTFSCSVSLNNSGCCITVYKFQYPEKYTDPEICREKFPPDPCEQRNNFTCSFSPTTVMTGEFRFFIQINQGPGSAKFTVNITEPSKPEPVTEDPGRGSTALIVTGAVVGCSIVIVMAIFCVKRFKTQQPFWIPDEI